MIRRILIHDYAGHPFQIQLSRELSRRGYEVFHFYSGYNNTPKGNLKKDCAAPKNLHIEAIYTKKPIKKYSFVKRWVQEVEYGYLLASKIREIHPDLVLSGNAPLDTQNIIINCCHKHGIQFVFWLQDISGTAAYKLLKAKVPIVGGLIGMYHIKLEQRLLRQSDAIVSITNDFNEILENWGVYKEKITVIPNWAPLDEVPVKSKVNPWSKSHEIADKLCLMYTGGMGLKHNPDLILKLALHYKDRNDLCICIVSEGKGADYLKQKKQELSIANLVFFGYQPFEDIPDVLGSGDILISILESDAGAFSVPSKTLTYLCAQRPLLLAVPKENLAARIVTENNAGLVVSPDDDQGFIQAAEQLLLFSEQREVFAKNARCYAEKNFNIKFIADKFENLLL